MDKINDSEDEKPVEYNFLSLVLGITLVRNLSASEPQ